MIVDAEKGLAIVSRSVIPFDLGVLTLTFAESVIIPGKVLLVLDNAYDRSNISIQHWVLPSSHGIPNYWVIHRFDQFV
jgi:hypothetical protein